MQKTKSVQPLSVVGNRLELKENSNLVGIRKWFYDSFHARNHGHTMADEYTDQRGQNNARFEGKKRFNCLYISQHTIFVLCALSYQWDRWESETWKGRLSSWYLQPIQKHQKSLITAWLPCVLLSPFSYWESYFVSSSFHDSNLFT